MNKFLKTGGYRLIPAFIFVIFLFVSQTPAQAINAILKKVDDHRKALTSLRANIKMAKYNPSLDETDMSDGKIMFVTKTSKQDYLLRIDWQAPRNEVLAISGGQYIAYNPNTKQAFTGAANSKEAVKKGGNALSFMNMSKADLQTNYTPQLLANETLGDVPTWHLKFTPKTKSDYKSAEIWVDQNGMIIQARLSPNSGDESLYRLTNIEKNPSLKAAQFVVTLPKDVKIIKS